MMKRWTVAAGVLLATPCTCEGSAGARQGASWERLRESAPPGVAPAPPAVRGAPVYRLSGPSCEPRGTFTICTALALGEECAWGPAARVARDLKVLEERDPRILLNLAKAGITIRFDPALASGLGAGALYDWEGKALVLAGEGEHALYELAHAVDDVLQPDDPARMRSALARLRLERARDSRGVLSGLELFLAGWDSRHFLSAASPEFLEAYKEYVPRARSGAFKMSWADDDIRRLLETYMWAFGHSLDPEKNRALAAGAPLLNSWVRSSLERLAALDDLALFKARLDGVFPGRRDSRSAALRRSLERGLELRLGRGEVPSFPTLAEYCAAPDPFAVELPQAK